MADIDRFKQINDTLGLGHQTGDAVLQAVARRMKSGMRPYDALGRYGGEEFLLIAPGCDKGDGSKLAYRIRAFVPEDMDFTKMLLILEAFYSGATFSAWEEMGKLPTRRPRQNEVCYRIFRG